MTTKLSNDEKAQLFDLMVTGRLRLTAPTFNIPETMGGKHATQWVATSDGCGCCVDRQYSTENVRDFLSPDVQKLC